MKALSAIVAIYTFAHPAFAQPPQPESPTITQLVDSIISSPPQSADRWQSGAALVVATVDKVADFGAAMITDQEIDAIANLLTVEPRWAAFTLESIGPRAARAIPQMQAAVLATGGSPDGRYMLPSSGKWEAICEAIPMIASDNTFGPCQPVIQAAASGGIRPERTRQVFDFDPSIGFARQ